MHGTLTDAAAKNSDQPRVHKFKEELYILLVVVGTDPLLMQRSADLIPAAHKEQAGYLVDGYFR